LQIKLELLYCSQEQGILNIKEFYQFLQQVQNRSHEVL